MPTGTVARGPYGFKGGLHTKAGAFTLPPDCMSAAQNVYVYGDKLYKLAGSAFINTLALNSSAPITGLCDWQAVNQNRYLVIVAGSKIYSDLNLGVTPSDITGAATITATANSQHTFASLNNILAICGGTTPDTPLQWTGTGNVSALAGTPTVGNLVTVCNNIMFISGNAANPSGFWWSNPSDPGTWPAPNNLNFRASDGDIITAIAPMGLYLIIFKRRSTGSLYTQTTTTSSGSSLGPLSTINTAIGCAGSQAWDVMPTGQLVVFGIDGHLRIFDGTTYTDISDPPMPFSNIQPTLDACNIPRFPFACVRVYPMLNQVWLAISTAGMATNDSIFIYDYVQMIWMCQVPDRAANVMVASLDSRGTPKHPIVLLSGSYGGFVYEHDTGSTNAQNTDGHIDGYGTCSIQLGVESSDYEQVSVRVAQEGQSIGLLQVGYGFNDLTNIQTTVMVNSLITGGVLDTTFMLDVSVLGGSTILIGEIRTPSNGRIFTSQVQFRNPFGSQPFIVHPFWISSEVIT
jgi:hypothetical protein